MFLCIDLPFKTNSTILYVGLQDFFFIYTFFLPRKSIKECECRVGKSGLKSRSPVLQLGEGGTVPHSDEACFTILISGAHFPYKVVNRAAGEASAEAQVPQNHCQIFVCLFFS